MIPVVIGWFVGGFVVLYFVCTARVFVGFVLLGLLFWIWLVLAVRPVVTACGV